MDTGTHRGSSQPLPDLLEQWVAAGLLSAAQAAAIERHESGADRSVATRAGAPGPSLVVEALGYVGGLVMVVGAGILVGTYWADLSVAARLVLLAGTAGLLVGAGFLVPDRLGEAAGRLRAVLWAAGVASTGAFAAVLCNDVLDLHDEEQLWVVGGAASIVAAVLWWLRRTWLQQLALFVPLLLTAVGLGLRFSDEDMAWGGGAVWLTACAWGVLAWVGWMTPRVVGTSFAGAGAVVGATSMGNDLGIVLALLTAVALVLLAMAEQERAWLAVGALAVMFTAPRAASAWFPGRLSAALTFLVTGGLLVAAAVWVARRHGPEAPPSGARASGVDDAGPRDETAAAGRRRRRVPR